MTGINMFPKELALSLLLMILSVNGKPCRYNNFVCAYAQLHAFPLLVHALSPSPLSLFLLFLFPAHTAQTFKCYCNQFNTVGCIRKNSTWGECSATAGKQLCIAAWERSPIDSLIIVEYFCSDAALLRYSCLRNGVQMLGSKQFPIVKVCCESDYCNGPTRLQSFVDALVTGMRYQLLLSL